MTTGRPKLCLGNPVLLVNLDRESHVRATHQRSRTPAKARLIRIADITRLEEMIAELHRYSQSATLSGSQV
jgi:hypothetical protein